MKLEQVKISRFRSIKEAKSIPIGDFTVLIGKNNEGKSNILRAINMAMIAIGLLRRPLRSELDPRRPQSRTLPRSYVNRQIGYSWDRDFPETLKRAKKGDKNTEVTLTFSFNEEETENFKDQIGSSIDGRLPITITFSKDNDVKFTVRKQGPGGSALTKKSGQIAAFISKNLRFEYIEAVRTAKRASEEVDRIVRGLLYDLNDEDVIGRALSQISEMQAPILEKISEDLTNSLREFLPNIKSAKVLVNNDERLRAFSSSVEVIVDDGAATPISQKGDGVQSLASLALAKAPFHAQSKIIPRVLAIEEPEVHLHPKAIRDLKSIIFDMTADAQVIVSTHSPLFVNAGEIGSNIIVDSSRASPARRVEEIRECLGVEPPDNLIGTETAILCEGVCDKIFLEKYIRKFHSGARVRLVNGQISIVSSDGADRMSYLLKLYQSFAMRCLVLLDDDGAGRVALKNLIEENSVLRQDAFVCSVEGRQDTEIEDFIPFPITKEVMAGLGYVVDKKFESEKSRFSKRLERLSVRTGKPIDAEAKRDIKIALSERIKEISVSDLDINQVPSIDFLVASTSRD